MLPLSLILVLAQAPQPPAKPKVPELVVALEDRSITLPRLPGTGTQGRTQFKEVHAQVTQAMADLNHSLRALYARKEAGPLAAELSVPQELAEEGAALVQIVDDTDFARLERAYLDTWKAWQAVLIEGGVARRQQTAARSPEPGSKEFTEAKTKALAVLKAPARQLITVTRSEAAYRSPEEDDTFTPERLGATPLRQEERAAASIVATKEELDTQNRLAVTDLLLPDLAARWDALSEHLNAVALRVLIREEAATPTTDGPLTALRAHAKLAVLERFRKALFYCDLVWCQVAAAAPPPPPPRLAPARRAAS